MPNIGKKMLLVGGLGHTDLSGKVPRPGLLMLRKALRQAGHDAVIANYSTTLMHRMFPEQVVKELAHIYTRSIKPFVIEGKKLLPRLWKIPQLAGDMKRLQEISQELARIERGVFQEVGAQISRRVKDEEIDAVGFSLYLGSSSSGSIAMAEILRRENPNTPIFFGGPQTTHFSETIYRETQAPTALVLGEGELSIVRLAEILDALKAGRLNDLSRIPNLVYRAEDGSIIATPRQRISLQEWIEISAVPYQPGDFEGLMRYAFVETSRGCFYRCRFCPQPLLSGTQRYLKPAARVVDEMVENSRRFGITHFEFVGSSTPPGQAEEIADALMARGLQDEFKWVLFMRGKDERPAAIPLSRIMEKIKSAGGSAIFFGVESADNVTLQKMGKKGTIEDTENAMLAAKEAGIATIGSFIYPYPGMAAKEGKQIVAFAERVRPLSAPAQALGIFPGTHAAEHAEEIGCEFEYPEAADQKLYQSGQKPKPSMQSPEVQSQLFNLSVILSLPMHLWPRPFPYKIDGMSYKEYVRKTSKLSKQIAKLGILTGFSHSHFLISQVMGMSPEELSERMFYCSLTGDPEETSRLIDLFNSRIKPGH